MLDTAGGFVEAEGIGAVKLRGFGLYRLRNTAIELANHSNGIKMEKDALKLILMMTLQRKRRIGSRDC
jgi:hypothetical protein